MNNEQIKGIVRHIATALGGVAVSAGYLSESDVTTLAGGLAILIGLAASIISKFNRGN